MNIKVVVSEDVPRDEVWMIQVTGRRLEQEVTPVGLALKVVEQAKIIGKIIGLR